ncbi:DUF3488 and transglutaminase-like domain-containing protein [Streptomyces sp. NBC_00433]
MSSAPGRPVRTAPLSPHTDGPDWAWAAPTPRPTAAGAGQRRAALQTAPAHGLGRARRLWSLPLVAALTAASGYGFHRVFTLRGLLPVVSVAAVVPVALSAVLSGLLLGKADRPPRPLWPSVLLTVVAWLATVSATLFRGAGSGLPTPSTVRTEGSALLDAPHAVLTVILPAPGDHRLLVLPHAVLWLAAFAAAELALRTSSPLLPAVPAVLALGVPLLLGVDGTGSNTPAVAALAGLAAALALVRSRAHLSGRALGLGLPFAAGLALAAGLLGTHLPGLGTPYDPRGAVPPATVRPQTTSPLDEVAAWMRNGDEKVFTVKAAAAQNYRLAVLDTYDGVTWSPSAKLTRTGGRVPAPQGTAAPVTSSTLTQRFTIQQLPGIWLPAADRPAAVHTPAHTSVLVDPDTGVLSTGEDIPSGLTYSATSQVPVYDSQRLEYADVADDPIMLALPRTDAAGRPIPAVDTFQQLAAQATGGSTYPYQQASRLADWLRNGHAFDPAALPGHTYRSLEFFLTTGKRGTSEQFAASYAVMARTLGLPARVVVGFRPGARIAPGTWQITGKDVLAWPEVEFKGVGWVPFYPTPGETSKSGASAPPAGEPKQRQDVDRDITGQARPTTAPKASGHAAAGSQPGGGSGGLPTWAWALVLLLTLTCGYLLYAAWVPHRRRARRRGNPDTRLRVIGAWQQITDRLTEIGLPATGAHTAQEVAAFGQDRVGGAAGARLPQLAQLVNEIGYGGRPADLATADAAWSHCDIVEKAVLATVPRRERLRRALRPAALLGR